MFFFRNQLKQYSPMRWVQWREISSSMDSAGQAVWLHPLKKKKQPPKRFALHRQRKEKGQQRPLLQGVERCSAI